MSGKGAKDGSRAALVQKAWQVHTTLIAQYGEARFQRSENPVDELIATLLSANTNDANSGRAFAQLKAHFGDDWEAVRTAPIETLKALIRPAGMYNPKSPGDRCHPGKTSERLGLLRFEPSG
jgi:endonuclease-3